MRFRGVVSNHLGKIGAPFNPLSVNARRMVRVHFGELRRTDFHRFYKTLRWNDLDHLSMVDSAANGLMERGSFTTFSPKGSR